MRALGEQDRVDLLGRLVHEPLAVQRLQDQGFLARGELVRRDRAGNGGP